MEKNKELLNAIKKKSHVKVKYWLDQGADPNLTFPANHGENWSVLMTASQCGLHKCVAALINAGANVNLEANNGVTALSEAFRLFNTPGHYDTINLLIDAGANVNRYVDNYAADRKMLLLHLSLALEINAAHVTDEQRDLLLLKMMKHGANADCVNYRNESLSEALRRYQHEDAGEIHPSRIKCLIHSLSVVNQFLEQQKLEVLIKSESHDNQLKF